jgi:RING finger protein 113A
MEMKEKEMEQFLTRFKESAERGQGVYPTEGNELHLDDKDLEMDKVQDGLPFACFICRKAFQEPIVTPCGHYFCQKCILQSVMDKSTACPICSKDTNGVFNHPAKLVAKKRRLVGPQGTWEEFRDMQR